jgi:hypothetical protein
MTVDELRARLVELRAQEQAARDLEGLAFADYLASLRNLEPARLDGIEDLLRLAEWLGSHWVPSALADRLRLIAARMLGVDA